MPKLDFSKVSREDKKKFLILIAVFVVIIAVCIPLVPYFNSLLDPANRQELVSSIQQQGFVGVLIVLGFQVLQVVVAFIPGEVVQILAGVIYGTFGGLLICIVGLLISTTIVYKVVNKLGMPLVKSVVPEKYLEKLEFLNHNKRTDLIVFVLFLIPGLPKDVFTYFIPLTGMPFGRFLCLSTIARVPGLIASTYAGAAFLEGNYTGMIVIFVIFGGLGLLGIIFRDQILDFLGAKKQKVKEQIREFADSRIKGINRLGERRKKGELHGQEDIRRLEDGTSRGRTQHCNKKYATPEELDEISIDDNEATSFPPYRDRGYEQHDEIGDANVTKPDFVLRDEDFDDDTVELKGYVQDEDTGKSGSLRSTSDYKPTYRRKRT